MNKLDLHHLLEELGASFHIIPPDVSSKELISQESGRMRATCEHKANPKRGEYVHFMLRGKHTRLEVCICMGAKSLRQPVSLVKLSK